MKNLLEKKSNTGVVISIAFAAVAAGTVAYLYLTKSGENTRTSVRHKLKDRAKDLVSGAISKKTGISKETLKKIADFIVK